MSYLQLAIKKIIIMAIIMVGTVGIHGAFGAAGRNQRYLDVVVDPAVGIPGLLLYGTEAVLRSKRIHHDTQVYWLVIRLFDTVDSLLAVGDGGDLHAVVAPSNVVALFNPTFTAFNCNTERDPGQTTGRLSASENECAFRSFASASLIGCTEVREPVADWPFERPPEFCENSGTASGS